MYMLFQSTYDTRKANEYKEYSPLCLHKTHESYKTSEILKLIKTEMAFKDETVDVKSFRFVAQ